MKKKLSEVELGKIALDRQRKQYKRQNEYIETKYDRCTVTLPKGTRDAIKASGESVNGLVNRLVKEWLDHNK